MLGKARDRLGLNVATVRRFADALRKALYDKRLEESSDVHFYHDADVVMPMIYGFEQFRYSHNPSSDERVLLVRALLSSGYLGQVLVLRPHALEIDLALRNKLDRHGEGSPGDYKRRLESFLVERGIREDFDRLWQIVEDVREGDLVTRFLAELGAVGHDTFISIELANGNLEQRMVRLGKEGIVRFDQQEDDLRRTLRDPIVWRLRELIGEQRKGDKSKYSESVLRDATALTMLHHQIRARDAGERLPIVRFYTETDVLREAWENNPELKSLLSYKSFGVGTGDLGFVFRDADYFILRASLDELHFPLSGEVSVERAGIGLGQLEAVSAELDSVLGERGGKLSGFLESRRLGATSLEEVVGQFATLSFLEHIWVRYKPPEQMRKFIAGFTEVWSFAQEGDSGREVRERIRLERREVGEKLRVTVKGLRDWYLLFQSIQKSSDENLRGKADAFYVPDPIKDLGLVRWGIELSPKSLEAFPALIQPLLVDEIGDWWRGCADLTDLIRSIDGDFDRCALACAALWSLSDYQTILVVIGQYRQWHRGKWPIEFRLLFSAAQIHSGDLGFAEKAEILRELAGVIDDLGGAQRPKLLVGLGYLFFHSWHSERAKDLAELPKATNAEEQLSEWLETSFSLGEEAVRLLERSTLSWAFAINHCSYVGSSGGLDPERVRPYLRQLSRQSANRSTWNYRFADTLGYHYFLLATRFYSALGRPAAHLGNQERTELFGHLASSFEVYSEAKAFFGDREITAHQRELRNFATEVEYPGESTIGMPGSLSPDGGYY